MVLTTRAAWAVLAGAALLVWWPTTASVALWVLAVAVLAAVDVALAPSPRRLRLERTGPPQARLGEPVHTDLLVTNPDGASCAGCSAMRGRPRPEPPRTGTRCASPPVSGSASVRHLHPRRRGDRVADLVTVRTVGPLGLAAPPALDPRFRGRVRVLHPFPSRRHLPSRLARAARRSTAARRCVAAARAPSSTPARLRRGRRRAFHRLARHRPAPVLVVRTWQPEQHRRVVIVIDTSRTSAGRVGDVPRLDAAMDAALLLTALAGQAHDRVDVIAGDQVVSRPRRRSGRPGQPARRRRLRTGAGRRRARRGRLDGTGLGARRSRSPPSARRAAHPPRAGGGRRRPPPGAPGPGPPAPRRRRERLGPRRHGPAPGP